MRRRSETAAACASRTTARENPDPTAKLDQNGSRRDSKARHRPLEQMPDLPMEAAS
jgi:hypothetical protein